MQRDYWTDRELGKPNDCTAGEDCAHWQQTGDNAFQHTASGLCPDCALVAMQDAFANGDEYGEAVDLLSALLEHGSRELLLELTQEAIRAVRRRQAALAVAAAELAGTGKAGAA